MKIANLISRIIVGVVFIFSGFVKAIDPLGSVYKFNDYFEAFGMQWMEPASLFLAIFMSSIEFIVGFSVLFGLRTKLSSLGGLLFMAFFTPLTLYIALKNPVTDCGCFGDALILSNTNTFIKNIFILIAAIIVFFYRKKFKTPISSNLQWGLVLISALFIVFISVHSYRHEPLIDFRPWKVGNKIADYVNPIPEIAEVSLVYKNKTTGELKEYPMNNYPWNDSVWVANWEFVDQKKKVIQEYKKAPISDFIIHDVDDNDLTEEFVNNPNYQFMLFAYDLVETNKEAFSKINEFASKAEKDSLSFIGLTAAPFSYIDEFRHDVQAPFQFYLVDEIALKTAIRSNPGLILLKSGVVIAKWGHRDLPSYEEVKKDILK